MLSSGKLLPAGRAVLVTLVRRVLSRPVRHEVRPLLLGHLGGLGLARARAALSEPVEGEGADADRCDGDASAVHGCLGARGEGFPLFAGCLFCFFGLLVEVLVGG